MKIAVRCLVGIVLGVVIAGCGSKHTGNATTTQQATVRTARPAATADPSGGLLAFKRFPGAEDSEGTIFTIDPHGNGEHRVTHVPAGFNDDQPQWSPDGSTLLFSRCPTEGGVCDVMTIKPDGSGLKQLGDHCAQTPPKCVDDSDPGWSPNGKQIVFTRSTGKIRPSGGTFTEDQIQHSAIMIEKADGTHSRKVVELPPYAADLHYPMWSPDGQTIVFVVRNSESAKPPLGQAVFSVRIDGSRLKRLTPWGPRFGDAGDFSPDGKLMVFRTEPVEHGPGGQIYLMHSDGTHRRALTHFDNSVRLFSSTFSPDGKSVVFGKAAGTVPDLVSVGVDGSNEHAVTHTTSWESAPDWGPPASG